MKGLFVSGICIAITASVNAAVLYDVTNPNPPVAYGNVDKDAIMLDDILVPSNRSNGNRRIFIQKIEAKMFAPRAGTYTIKAWAAISNFNSGPIPVFPPTLINTQSMTFASNEIKTLTIGDGTSTLFSTSLFPIINSGNNYGVFFFGFSFSESEANVGWTQADGPDFNLNGFWSYYGANDPRNRFQQFAGNYRSSFNIKITGFPIPEPSTSLPICAGLVLIRIRRRSRK